MKVFKNWVTFWSPGSFVANESTRDYDDIINPYEVEFPDHAYAFRVFRREDIVEGDKTYKGDAVQQGVTYYHPDSKITTLAQVKAMSAEKRGHALVSNMECNKWDSVIWTRWDNWPQPYDADSEQIL